MSIIPELRVLGPADALDLHALEQLVTGDAWSVVRFTELLGQPRFMGLGAFCGPDLRGYVTAYTIGGETEIVNVAVHPAWRGMGVGSALLGRLVELAVASGVERIVLEVRASNLPAQAVYAKAGFVQAGIRPRYYAVPCEDALILVWTAPGGVFYGNLT